MAVAGPVTGRIVHERGRHAGGQVAAFKVRRWYKPLYLAVLFTCVAIGIWLLGSGALAIWDRYSPEKSAPLLPWFLAIPVALIGGFFAAVVVMMQLELLYERWRDKRNARVER